MLTPLTDFKEILRSPDDGSALITEFDSNGILKECRSVSRNFPVNSGIPTLFPKASVFSASNSSESPVVRKKSKMLRRISLLINGANPIARVNSRKLIRRLKDEGKKRVLVVGAGIVGEGSEPLYDDPDIDVIAFDVYRTDAISFVADAHDLPLADLSVDAVWIQAVLEHMVDPHRVVSEVFRVLRPGGLLYAETPFMQQVHEGRYDFHRFTESGHRWLFKNFKLIDSGAVWGPGRTLQWAIRYFFWGITRNRNLAIVLTIPFGFVRLFDRLIPPGFASDGACNLYFFGEKAENTITVNDLLEFYRGKQ